MKSYAAAARDAKRQETKITEYIAKFVYDELEFDLQESLNEQEVLQYISFCSKRYAFEKSFMVFKTWSGIRYLPNRDS